MVSTNRIQTVPLKTLTTRIYIDDAKNHKVVQLTNLLTTAMVIQYLRKKGLLDSSNDWTLFEIDNDHGVGKKVACTLFFFLLFLNLYLIREALQGMGNRFKCSKCMEFRCKQCTFSQKILIPLHHNFRST